MYSSPSISSSAKMVAIAGCREGGGGARLARQPFAPKRVAREFRRERLERDRAPQPLVLGGVDDAHAAAPDFFEDVIGADAFRPTSEASSPSARSGADLPGRADRETRRPSRDSSSSDPDFAERAPRRRRVASCR